MRGKLSDWCRIGVPLVLDRQDLEKGENLEGRYTQDGLEYSNP